MKKLLYKLALIFFKRYVRVFYVDHYFSDLELITTKNPPFEYYKREMVFRMVEAMVKEGLVEFTTEKDVKIGGTKLRAKIRVI